MNTEKLNDWLQIVGIFAVVASLLFVGLQLKQSQDIALSQASQTRTALSIDMILSTAENSQFIASAARRRSGSDQEQTLEAQIALSQYATAILMSYEDQYFQYSNGFLTDERWEAAKSGLKNFMRDSASIPVRHTYERFPARFTGSFQVVIDGLIAEVDAAKKSDSSP